MSGPGVRAWMDRRAWRAALGASVLAGAALLAPGCGEGGGSSEPAAGKPVAIEAAAGEGLRAVVTLDRAELTTAERIGVRVEVTLGPGLELEKADVAAALPKGLSLEEQPGPDERRATSGGRSVVVRRLSIEPLLPGEYEIGPIEIVARRGAAAGAVAEAEPIRASTPSMQVTVRSVLAEGDTRFAGATDVVDPKAEAAWWPWLLGALVPLLGAAVWLWLRSRRDAGPALVLVPAHEVALRRLAALMEQKLVERGMAERFFGEASLILRRYIEDRFGLRAPERTTEEFLAEAGSSMVLFDEDVRVLGRFLSRADMVKFAAVVPGSDEAERAAALVRDFVERTRSDARLIEEPASEERRGVDAAAGAVTAGGAR